MAGLGNRLAARQPFYEVVLIQDLECSTRVLELSGQGAISVWAGQLGQPDGPVVPRVDVIEVPAITLFSWLNREAKGQQAEFAPFTWRMRVPSI